jgi:hypothetical protein
LPWLATGSGNNIHLFVTVVLSRESDPLSVRREFAENLDAGVRSQTQRIATCRGRGPKIAGVSENYAVAANVGKPQEFRLGICGDGKNENAGNECSETL